MGNKKVFIKTEV